jgi:predicted nucleotidyltransferase
MIESDADRYVAQLVAAYPAIREVWLFGSRANGTAREDSDWDYLAFGDWAVLDALRLDARFRRKDVDLLIVTNGERFETPWLQPTGLNWGSMKDDLEGLRWKQLSPTTATYTATKSVGARFWDVEVLPNQKARRVYP